MKQVLILFDIDGTLIAGSSAHKLAFAEAIKQVYGIDTSVDTIPYHGMTDPQILHEILRANGTKPDIIEKKFAHCLDAVASSFNRHIHNDPIAPLAGVVSLLQQLKKRSLITGLVTGNLESIARGKLRKITINHYFPLGGFGSDHSVRYRLVEIATERAQKMYNFEKGNNVILVGDTPRDVEAAKKADVLSIAVATGYFALDELQKTGADLLLPSLTHQAQFLRFLQSVLPSL